MASRAIPTFWRDPSLPHLEARAIADGRDVCYARHAHEAFSIGLVTGGACEYLNGRKRETVHAGTVVLMNPGDVHACNPAGADAWSYRMFYVDSAWLGTLQHALGVPAGVDLHAYAPVASRSRALQSGLAALYQTCVDPAAGALAKETAAVDFFTAMHATLAGAPARAAGPAPSRQLQRAAEFIRDRCMDPVRLDDICAAAGLSPSHLVRAFKARHGMTPHAWLVNCRIEYARRLLRQGLAIADAAQHAGFADQAHLQRTFKQHVAATPGQYRGR